MFAGGGAAMFNRQKFLELGGFEPLLSPFYWEDVDLSYRAWKRGYVVLYEPRSLVRHQISSTIQNFASHKVRSIQQRNRLIYHWINLHDKALLASHILWVTLLAATAPLRLQPEFVSAVLAALKLLTRIRERRREERARAQRSDREVYELFSALVKRADIVVYDNPAELKIRKST